LHVSLVAWALGRQEKPQSSKTADSAVIDALSAAVRDLWSVARVVKIGIRVDTLAGNAWSQGGLAMRQFFLLAVLSGCLSACGMVYAQNTQRPVHIPDTSTPENPSGRHEPAALRRSPPSSGPEEEAKLKPRIDVEKVRKDAQELAALAQTMPAEVDQLSKHVLPKDLAQQLKQIEKLAKHLRAEINP
jgi:hypothetical protein